MPDGIGVVLTGERYVSEKFDEFPQQLRGRLKEVITKKAEKLAGLERAAAPERTGRLKSQIRARVIEKPDAIIGIVGIDAPKGSRDFAKAGAEEYGGTGDVFKVRAHEANLSHLWSRPAQLRVQVAEHTRYMLTPARRFVRDPAAAMAGEIEQALRGAVSDSVDEANR